MADTLEENYVLDDHDDALSAHASDVEADAVSLVEGEPELDQEGSDPEEPQRSSNTAAAAEEAERKENKKRKRKEKEKARKVKRAAVSAEFAQGTGSVATQPPEMQADYLSAKQVKSFSKLSELELDEIRLRQAMLIDTTAFTLPRTEDSLADFVRTCIPDVVTKLQDASNASNTKNGQPLLIVLTGNAQRAADLSRSLRLLGPPSQPQPVPTAKATKSSKVAVNSTDKPANGSSITVAKLFARHFKLKEHEAWLKDHLSPLATGTPQRVAALISSGSLSLDSLAAIVIDQTWVDQKQRNVFDTPETRDELMKLLALDKVVQRLQPNKSKSNAKLALF